MARKYGIQLRGLGRALKPKGPGVLRPKPTDRYGQQMKPKPIRPGKKDGGMLKAVKPSQKGLAKLPKAVRNKMGYMKDGGRAKKKKETEEGTKPKDLIYKPNKMERLKQLREELGMKKGGRAKFPDLSGDGKVTKKDILMGRGVIKKGKK